MQTLLFNLQVPLYRVDGVLTLEDQACNGLRLWAENFGKLLVIAPEAPGPAPKSWVPLDAVGPNLQRIEIHTLPTAYRPGEFFRALGGARQMIRGLIDRADYLSFAIGGLFGDWGAVAAWEAHRKGRPFAVWTDRVESQVVRQSAQSGPLKSRLRSHLYHRPMAWIERAIIRRSSLGLFHGRETFDAFAPYSRNPHVVHDVHLAESDHIQPQALAAKIARAGEGPLRILYVGRADPMKGPMDWLQVVEDLCARNLDVKATWLGEGSELAAMRARVAAVGLQDRIALPGFLRDRSAVVAAYREAQVFLFCHKTAESPRCLIEALAAGTPILGYGGAFARDLVKEHQGGLLVERDDAAGLADLVAGLATDRARLGEMFGRAARDGAPYTGEEVFRHRSEIIRKELGPGSAGRGLV
jgi:colanic acid/amylovoran biosynthesis glycosyltransferase